MIEIPFPTYIDSSSLKAYKSCELQYYYKYLRHLNPYDKSIHLVAGGAYAEGLEVSRKAYYEPTSETYRQKEPSIIKGIEAIIAFWGDYEAGPSEVKTLDRVVRALVDYYDVYDPETDHIQPYMWRNSQGEHPAVELTFSIPLNVLHPQTGKPILYVGRYDMLGEHAMQKTLFVVDEKTTTQLGKRWANQWSLRSQFTGYCYAAQEYGHPVVGAVIRGTSFLSHEKFGQAEVITYRSAAQIKKWVKATEQLLEQMKVSWSKGYYRPDLDDACSAYSGCDFKLLCERDNPEKWVDTNYKVSKWDPMAVKG